MFDAFMQIHVLMYVCFYVKHIKYFYDYYYSFVAFLFQM